jgi:hypothetical protein
VARAASRKHSGHTRRKAEDPLHETQRVRARGSAVVDDDVNGLAQQRPSGERERRSRRSGRGEPSGQMNPADASRSLDGSASHASHAHDRSIGSSSGGGSGGSSSLCALPHGAARRRSQAPLPAEVPSRNEIPEVPELRHAFTVKPGVRPLRLPIPSPSPFDLVAPRNVLTYLLFCSSFCALRTAAFVPFCFFVSVSHGAPPTPPFPPLLHAPNRFPSRPLPSQAGGHTSAITAVACCAVQGSSALRVLTGSLDKSARLWDGLSGRPLARLEGHAGLVTAVAIAKVSVRGGRQGRGGHGNGQSY